MLTLHFAEKKQGSSNLCPMPAAIQVNFVSQLQSKQIAFPRHEGPLSIKCCFHGQEIYEVEGGRSAVDDSSYLVLNEGQQYASSICSHQTTESFCIWFRPSFAEHVAGSLRTPVDTLLDSPHAVPGQAVQFFERLYPHDTLVSPVLFRIHQAVNRSPVSQPWLEEQFHLLLEKLLQAHRNIYRDIERLPATRQATRVELYRRLYRAKDFLDASLELSVTLPEAAAVACLAPHHFLRQFQHLFRETPHRYHRRKRLERAQHLLVKTEQSVTDICFGLGFESLGSFCSLFHHFYGMSPTQYRARFAHRQGIRLLSREANGASQEGTAPALTV